KRQGAPRFPRDSSFVNAFVIAQSISNDPAPLAAQASPGRSPPQRTSAKAEAIPGLAGGPGLIRSARNDGQTSGADLTFAPFSPRFPHANVKSKSSTSNNNLLVVL